MVYSSESGAELLNIKTKCFDFCELFQQTIKPEEGVMESPDYSWLGRKMEGLRLLTGF